ncbi:MAG: VOC family protein [Betaproteobacteria bacterium]|nr:VOC family protein [Betaproteobacteria bacterium]
MDSIGDAVAAARDMRAAGVEVTEPKPRPDYAPDYRATFFNDPDGIRVEITSCRQERQERHDRWESNSA